MWGPHNQMWCDNGPPFNVSISICRFTSSLSVMSKWRKSNHVALVDHIDFSFNGGCQLTYLEHLRVALSCRLDLSWHCLTLTYQHMPVLNNSNRKKKNIHSHITEGPLWWRWINDSVNVYFDSCLICMWIILYQQL